MLHGSKTTGIPENKVFAASGAANSDSLIL